MWQILQLLFPKLLLFPPKKWMNLISDPLSTASIKCLNWPSPVFGRFQNGCNRVVIEPRVVQFWSEIILVISNWTCAAHSFNFEITHMISAQIALCSVLLPLFITPILKSLLVPVIWLALIGAIYSWIAPFFALNHIFFPASEEASLKTKQPIRFQGLLKTTNQIAGKWETMSIMRQIFVSKTLIFSPQKWMNFISNQLSTALNWPSPVLGRFQNGWNHAYDFSPRCTPLSSITIINICWCRVKENVIWSIQVKGIRDLD